jgi:hypothetical protein
MPPPVTAAEPVEMTIDPVPPAAALPDFRSTPPVSLIPEELATVTAPLTESDFKVLPERNRTAPPVESRDAPAAIVTSLPAALVLDPPARRTCPAVCPSAARSPTVTEISPECIIDGAPEIEDPDSIETSPVCAALDLPDLITSEPPLDILLWPAETLILPPRFMARPLLMLTFWDNLDKVPAREIEPDAWDVAFPESTRTVPELYFPDSERTETNPLLASSLEPEDIDI